MRKSFQIGAAFIGIVVGAGFASGQEILQFFTSFGVMGVAGSIIAAILFAFLGMNLTQLGSRLQTKSHSKVIYYICGRFFGMILDVIITFFLFGITVVMFAGAGVIFEQQFGVPGLIGSIVMASLTMVTLTLNVQKVIALISAFTPLLLLLVIIITVFTVINFDVSTVDLHGVATKNNRAAPNWILGAILYVSYNIAGGAAMLTVMGGTIKDEKVAGRGGIIGGVGLGILILLINISMLTQLKEIASVPMPMLFLANNVNPLIGIITSVIILGMIYNTAVAMLYAFSARIVNPETVQFKGAVVFFGTVAYGASFIGFTTLVGTVYPAMGYLGFMLIGSIFLSWMTKKKEDVFNHK